MSKINKKKITDLPVAETTEGLLTLGVDNTGKSVQVSINQLKGNKGDKGDAPVVGANGNWWIEGIDTGKPARGEDGTNIAYKVTFNVSQYNNVFNYTDETAARNAVPAALKGLGQQITYKLASGKWVNEQYTGTDVSGWTTVTNWKGIGGVENPVYSTKEYIGEVISWSSYIYEGTNWMNASGVWSTGGTTTLNNYILKLPLSAGTYKISADIIKSGSDLQKTIFIHSESGSLQTKYIASSFPYTIVLSGNATMTILENIYNNSTSSYEHRLSNIVITKDVEKSTFTDGTESIDIENLNTVITKIENLNTDHPFKNKRISILADSISAYTDTIPNGNSGWYPKNNVTSVNLMWWKRLMLETGAILDTNDSWGGAAISSYSPQAGVNSPYVSDLRVNRLGTPDVIFIFGGTNDFGGVHAPIGDYNFGNTQDTLVFKQAVTYLFQKLTIKYPNSKIICITPILRSDNKGIPAKDNGNFLFQFSEILMYVANIYGIKVIDLLKCGINYGNAASYLYDGIHPNANGMKLIADYVIKETQSI